MNDIIMTILQFRLNNPIIPKLQLMGFNISGQLASKLGGFVAAWSDLILTCGHTTLHIYIVFIDICNTTLFKLEYSQRIKKISSLDAQVQ